MRRRSPGASACAGGCASGGSRSRAAVAAQNSAYLPGSQEALA